MANTKSTTTTNTATMNNKGYVPSADTDSSWSVACEILRSNLWTIRNASVGTAISSDRYVQWSIDSNEDYLDARALRKAKQQVKRLTRLVELKDALVATGKSEDQAKSEAAASMKVSAEEAKAAWDAAKGSSS